MGKSALVAYLQQLLGCNKWNTIKLNGTQCKVETIQEIAQQLACTCLFGDWRMLWIDEADAIPPVAQVRFLTLLDDLPRGIAIACTSNCKLRDFEERFQTRFQAFEIAPPTTEEIVSLCCAVICLTNPKSSTPPPSPTAMCARPCSMPKVWSSAANCWRRDQLSENRCGVWSLR